MSVHSSIAHTPTTAETVPEMAISTLFTKKNVTESKFTSHFHRYFESPHQKCAGCQITQYQLSPITSEKFSYATQANFKLELQNVYRLIKFIHHDMILWPNTAVTVQVKLPNAN